jgi:hypothetical protein
LQQIEQKLFFQRPSTHFVDSETCKSLKALFECTR